MIIRVLSLVASRDCLFFLHRVESLSEGFVISKGTLRDWKEFPPFSISFHLFYDLRHELFILLLGVLFIQDAILFVFDSFATEAVFAGIDMLTIIAVVWSVFSRQNECRMISYHSYSFQGVS